MHQASSRRRLSGHARLSFMLVMGLTVVLLAGCSDEREVVFATDAPPVADDRQAVLADIAELSNGKELLKAEHAQRYHTAVDALIARGSRIESILIEELGGSNDWAVRLGVVEVLKGVATRRSIEPLMGALEDPQPLVALNADYLLRALTKHSVIPATGQAPINGLPPVPARTAEDISLDAEENLWAAWHQQHRVALHDAWRTWWQANQGTVVIE
jgi:HEAT repeat protein